MKVIRARIHHRHFGLFLLELAPVDLDDSVAKLVPLGAPHTTIIILPLSTFLLNRVEGGEE